jgi:capsular polysaccharide biosynthesis protein
VSFVIYSSEKHNAGIGAGLEVVASTKVNGADEDSLPLREIVRVLWRRLWLIIVVTVIIVGGAIGFGFTQTPTYEASTKLLVGQQQNAGDPYNLAGDVQGLQLLTKTLATAVNTRPVAQVVIRQLDLSINPNDLMANVQVQQISDTQFVQVTYKDTSPERAQLIANSIGDVFSAKISEISPKTSGVTITVWEPATMPTNPVSPNFLLILPLALVLGILLGVTLALLLEYWESGWRSAEEVERAFGRPVIAVIPAFEVSKGTKER